LPSASICQACGGSTRRGWRDQVRETVARHMEKRLQQEKRDDVRAALIFPKKHS
jgi:hypothetical protein